MRTSRILPVALTLSFATLVAGCYAYRPAESPAPGSTVRVGVPVASALASPNAAPRVESVEGVLVSNDDAIVLAVQTRRMFGAFQEVMQLDTLRLGLDQVATVEVREFSRGRSVALGIVIAAGLTGLAAAAFGAFGETGEDPPPPPPPPQPALVADRNLLTAIWRLVGG